MLPVEIDLSLLNSNETLFELFIIFRVRFEFILKLLLFNMISSEFNKHMFVVLEADDEIILLLINSKSFAL